MSKAAQEGAWVFILLPCLVGSVEDCRFLARGMLYDPALSMFAKIERFRSHGLDVLVAVELAAEQFDVDPESLARHHFAWLVGRYGDGTALDHDMEKGETKA